MLLAKHASGVLELGEELIIPDPNAEVIEVADDFMFDPDYAYDIVDGKPAKLLRLKLQEE